VNQLQLETILDTPIKISQLIKSKGKKLFSDDLKIETQTKLFKYINLMVKQDFISNHLTTIPTNELINAVRLLESQTPLIEELKKQQPLILLGIDEIVFLNEEEFKEILDKWKKLSAEMNDLQNNSKYQEEIISYKNSLTVSLYDLRKFSEKLWEYQHSIVQYNRICLLISKLKFQIQKYFLKEFHERVELLVEDF